ncbi:zinc ribbon domain-containing protein [Marinobacter sp. LV10MA510-1]|uniref:zinc ribbon domain-containing protein n=1 Tax=Marinobacter sp. LV10MA510-1 TaxID=1415567 RepID=UPI000C0170C4|nr:zinc ribbon domain-containing protein [Marinobacter sp. LV10MA510-1]PFG11278.1 hypothetical protein ATI45_3788 [Marinobacter sp. LV10MA510-1]
MSEVSRKCPYCAEAIKIEAVKCKHCGSEIDPLAKEQKKRLTREAATANYVPYRAYPVALLVFIAVSFWTVGFVGFGIYFQNSEGSSSSDSTAPIATEARVVKVAPVQPAAAVAPVEIAHWGDYQSTSGWEWKVFIIPENLSRNELITVARKTFAKHSNVRSRFFDDSEKIQEYIDAENFFWDTTGTVVRAEFPTEWRKQHLIAIIHDRSTAGYGRWQLVYNKGGVSEHLVFLE